MALQQRVEFESSVNSEYSKTLMLSFRGGFWFESSVNSEYSKTSQHLCSPRLCLRVV